MTTAIFFKNFATLADALDAKLNAAQAASARLLESVVRVALAAEPAVVGSRACHAGDDGLRQARMALQ